MAIAKLDMRPVLPATVTARARLWLTRDDELVADGDPRAARLLCTPGDEIPRELAERYGLVGDGPPQAAGPLPGPEEPPEQAPTQGHELPPRTLKPDVGKQAKLAEDKQAAEPKAKEKGKAKAAEPKPKAKKAG